MSNYHITNLCHAKPTVSLSGLPNGFSDVILCHSTDDKQAAAMVQAEALDALDPCEVKLMCVPKHDASAMYTDVLTALNNLHIDKLSADFTYGTLDMRSALKGAALAHRVRGVEVHTISGDGVIAYNPPLNAGRRSNTMGRRGFLSCEIKLFLHETWDPCVMFIQTGDAAQLVRGGDSIDLTPSLQMWRQFLDTTVSGVSGMGVTAAMVERALIGEIEEYITRHQLAFVLKLP